MLGFARPVSTLVVVGAADRLANAEHKRLQPLFGGLAALAERTGAAVVDGGTDTGVMRLLGRARARGHTFPLVGVVVAALARPAGSEISAGRWPLEPNHSHILLVPGREWGDEARWLARVATLVADGAPAVTLLVNGGRIAYTDAEASLAEGRKLIVAAGTGGTADALAADIRDGSLASRTTHVFSGSDLVQTIHLNEDGNEPLFTEIERILSPSGASNG